MNLNRIDFIDYAKGITIICVLLGHMEINPVLKHCIYSFHMPLFFILSGYFLKREKPNKYTIKKNFETLMIPYFIVGGGICLWQFFSDYDAFTKFETSSLASLFFLGYVVQGEELIRFVGAIWFLWVLFLSKIYTQHMLMYKYGGGIICVMAIFSIFYTRLTHVVLPFGVLQSLTASVFLLIGYKLKEKDLFNIHINKVVYCFMLILALILMTKAGVALRRNILNFNILSCVFSSYICYVIIKGLQMFDNVVWPCTKHIKSLLLFCGRNSLAFLCVHDIEYRIYCHWTVFDENLVGIEFLFRMCYILLIIKALSYFPLTKKIFRIL